MIYHIFIANGDTISTEIATNIKEVRNILNDCNANDIQAIIKGGTDILGKELKRLEKCQ